MIDHSFRFLFTRNIGLTKRQQERYCVKIKHEKEDLMKHPLWILNSMLLFLVLVALSFIFFSQEKKIPRESIEPEGYPAPIIKKEISKINISKIYEYDLFNTYKKEISIPEEHEFIIPPPQIPTPQPVSIPELPKPTFLDPLPITLKGIIIVANNEDKNRVIISDNKTNQEAIYKVSDMISDAQLIRIFNNKAIFIRSNGQQEVLYLREKDAMSDPVYALLGNWDNVIQKISDNNYFINPDEFINRITNLAQLIDILNLTTAYKKGESIGCRIGHLHENSLGPALGLRYGDIILSINNIPATTTQNRFSIYKEIIAMQHNDIITVQLLRNNREIMLYLTLQEFKHDYIPTTEGTVETQTISSLKKKYNFAPTLQEIKAREREHMLKKSSRPSHVNLNMIE